ncbi:hypothetical protein [Parasitella parasitica]|uniref:Uncharacterized protein n=1 Tax=Parasitella parasitica TaxID=35722 RepID=A0A0B7MXR2_9FUNG|nr:hypothetical protein [Parasitella parasitica]
MSVTSSTNNAQPLETKFSGMSLKNNDYNDQPLRRSTYNIFDAYDNNIPQNSSNLMDSYSIHPLEKVSDGYFMDLAPTSLKQKTQEDLNTMMKDLSLTSNDNNSNATQLRRSMPYYA